MTLGIVGMSPGNSYFKDREIAYLLRETIKKYGTIAIMVADIPAISTYIAMGYTLSKARTKAVSKGNSLKNKTRKVLEEIGIDTNKVIIIDRNRDIKNNTKYNNHYEQTRYLYKTNTQFQKRINETSKSVLENANKTLSDENLEQATHYILSEFAFLEFAPEYFGVEKVDYIYHKNRRVFEDYIAGIFDGKVRYYLDYMLLENPSEQYLYTGADSRPTLFEKVQQEGKIRCGFSPYISHFVVGEDGIISGESFELMQKIAKDLGLELEIVEQAGYGIITNRLNRGYFDIFCSPIYPTQQRKSEVFLSKSLFDSNIYAYLRSDSLYNNKTIEELKNEQSIRVVIRENDIHQELAEHFFPHARFVRVPQLSDPHEVIRFVLDNRGDIAFRQDTLTNEYLRMEGLPNDTLVPKGIEDGPLWIYQNCFALPRGEFEFKKAIDDGIDKFHIREKK